MIRVYLRSIAELAIEAAVLVRLLVAGRPDADALAAAGNPDTCPDLIEPPEYDAASPTELDLTWHSITTTRIGMATDLRFGTGLADDDLTWLATADAYHQEDSL